MFLAVQPMPALAGEIALDERAGVDVGARLECFADAVVEGRFEGAEAGEERVVVVGGAEFAGASHRAGQPRRSVRSSRWQAGAGSMESGPGAS